MSYKILRPIIVKVSVLANNLGYFPLHIPGKTLH